MVMIIGILTMSALVWFLAANMARESDSERRHACRAAKQGA